MVVIIVVLCIQRLDNGGLLVASGAVEAAEACTGTVLIVADSPTGAIPAGFISVSVQRMDTPATRKPVL